MFFRPEFFVDCNFDQGACEWVQDKADSIDWGVTYHDDGNGGQTYPWTSSVSHTDSYPLTSPVGAQYYMALSGLVGEQGDTAKMKLLLNDRAQQGSFCLTFDFRMLGQNVGILKVLLDNNSYPVWEQSQSRHQSWQTEFLTVAWKEEAPQAVSHVIGLRLNCQRCIKDKSKLICSSSPR